MVLFAAASVRDIGHFIDVVVKLIKHLLAQKPLSVNLTQFENKSLE